MAKAKQAFGPAEFTGKAPDPTNLPSLRELDEADGILQGFLAETEGELTPEIEGLDAWLKEATVGKFLRWGLWLRDRYAEIGWLAGQAAPFKTEYDRIIARKKALEHAVEWSEKLLLGAMRARDLPFVKSPLIEVKRRDNPLHVVGDELVSQEVLAKLFDDERTRVLVRYVPETFALDKAAVKAAAVIGALPEELKSLGVVVASDERIEVK